jgi:hypothetical protein
MRKQHALFLLLCAAVPTLSRVSEPALSLTAGLSRHVPHHAPGVRDGGGVRGGFSLPATLPAGSWRIPLEWGVSLRTADLRFPDSFDRARFIDFQAPLLVHGDPFGWKYLEPIALWTPGYTLDMTTTNAAGDEISHTDGLRTRFNMGFGGGLQAVYRGFRLRAHGVYNLFPPIAGAPLTYSDWTLEAAVPLFWKRGNR